MTKKLIAMALVAGAMLGAWAYKAESKNGYTWIYLEDGGEATICGLAENPSGTLTFPAQLGGLDVCTIGGLVKFESDGGSWQSDWTNEIWPSGVTKVVIPEGVTKIESGTFTSYDGVGWCNLQEVELPDSLESCKFNWVFGGTPYSFGTSGTSFPEFVTSRSGWKLLGVKASTVDLALYDELPDITIPAGITEVIDYALGRFCVNHGGYTSVPASIFRIIFDGDRPKATQKAFFEEWSESIEDQHYILERVYYRSGASGWNWGEEWCGVKTYALNEKPEEYTLASNLKFGRVYGGEMWEGYGFTERCIWNNNDVGLYGDEYAFFPVTGTGRITPVILGDVPVGYLDAPQVWTDQKMFETFTPKGVATSKWKDDGDEWEYEASKVEYEWPKSIWPDKKPVADRRWIVIHAKEKEVWSSVWSFRVGLAGTSEVSDPMILVSSEDCEQNGLQNLSPGDFFRGITISDCENFELWDGDVVFNGSGDYADLPRMQTYELENWRASMSGKAMTFKVMLPSAGTLVVSSEDEDDDDSPAIKKAYSINGSNIVSDRETVKSQDWGSPNYRYDVTNFWKTSYASHIRRIEVSGKTTLTLTSTCGEDNCEFTRMYFFPKNAKSVAVEVGHIKWESVDGEYTYWGRNYVQGYVTGCGVYKSGETATLKAVSGEGEEFDHWVVRFGNLTLTEAQKTSPTLSFTVTDAMCGEMEDEEQIFISAIWKPKYKITALPSIVGAGTVTGSGRYHEGAIVTLTATAADGCSFVKWSDGETASTRQIEVMAADVERVLYACFDAPNGIPDNGMTFGPFIAGDKVEVNVELLGYTAKGLPSGLKYDAKSGKVTGTAKTSGEYEVTFTKKGEDDVTVMFVVREEEVSVGCAGLSGGTFTAGVAGNANGIPLEIESETGVKSVAVAKLPAGMKYDAKTGLITGAPTKPGDYAVTVTVTTKSGAKRTETISISVAALPDNVVGAFNGFVKTEDGEENLGTFQLTTTDAGKLTAKVVMAAGSYSFSGTCWDKVEGDIYSATLAAKKGETLTLSLDSAAGWDKNQLTGNFTAVAGRPPYPVVARKNAFGKTWYFNAEGNERDGWRLSYAENAKAAALTVTLNADGSTKIAGKLVDAQERVPPISVSASGYADVTSLSEGAIIADFAPVVSMKNGKASLKKALSIRANLWFDRLNDHAEGVGSAKLVEEDR